MATCGQQQRGSRQRKKGRSDGADAPDNPQQSAGETGRETPDDATSGPAKEPARDDKRPVLLFPEASASTPQFSTPEWVDSPVLGGAKSSTLRDEAVPSFLAEVLPEGGPARSSPIRPQEPRDSLELRDEDHEMGQWRDTMTIIQDKGPGPGFNQDEWTRCVRYLAGGLATGEA